MSHTRRQGGIETICEYLETCSDKSISCNSLCDLASFILKNNYFENEELKYHQKKFLLLGPCLLLHTLTSLWQDYKTEFFKTMSLNVVTIPWKDFFVYGPKVLKT